MTRHKQILSEAQKRFSSNDTHLVSKISTFIDGAKWADEHPNTEDIDVVLAYTHKGLGWLLENIEPGMGTTRERALACAEVLQQLCMDVITVRKERQL